MKKLTKISLLLTFLILGALNTYGINTNPPTHVLPVPKLDLKVEPTREVSPIIMRIEHNGGDDKLTQRSFANLETQVIEMAQEEIARQNTEASEEEEYYTDPPVYAKFHG